jgi:hypothetical protein
MAVAGTTGIGAEAASKAAQTLMYDSAIARVKGCFWKTL